MAVSIGDRTRWTGGGQTGGAVLFVVAAHVANERNGDLLNGTVRSIQRYHPTMPILVVDNASPAQRAGDPPTQRVEDALGPSRTEYVRVMRTPWSAGQLGSWALADRELGPGGAYAAANITRVILLQHSTRLSRKPLFPRDVNAGLCPLVAAAGSYALMQGVNVSAWDDAFAPLKSRLDPNLALAILEEVGPVPCAQCIAANRSGVQASALLPWALARHGVLDCTRPAFEALGELGLWGALGWSRAGRPQLDAVGSLARVLQSRGACALGEWNQDLERLAGILVIWFAAGLPGLQRAVPKGSALEMVLSLRASNSSWPALGHDAVARGIEPGPSGAFTAEAEPSADAHAGGEQDQQRAIADLFRPYPHLGRQKGKPYPRCARRPEETVKKVHGHTFLDDITGRCPLRPRQR